MNKYWRKITCTVKRFPAYPIEISILMDFYDYIPLHESMEQGKEFIAACLEIDPKLITNTKSEPVDE